MKKRLICMALVLAVFASCFVLHGTYAWFRSDAGKKQQDITLAKMYDIRGELGSPYEIKRDGQTFKVTAPGTNLLVTQQERETNYETLPSFEGESVTISDYVYTALSCVNQSTIDTQLRIKIEFSEPAATMGALQVYSDPFRQNHLDVAFADSSKWVYSAVDNFWHYNPTGATSGQADYCIVKATATDDGDSTQEEAIPLINSISFNGGFYNEEHVGYVATVTLKVQAKQAYYAEWSDIAWSEVQVQL